MIFLKFADKAEAEAVLAEFIGKESKHFAIELDVPITQGTGVMMTDDDGTEYEQTEPVPGYHVNLRLIGDEYSAQADELLEYRIYPETPQRVFF